MAKKPTHNFSGRFLHWTYCTKCGLMLLKNNTSRKAANKPCDSEWEAARLRKSQLERITWVKK